MSESKKASESQIRGIDDDDGYQSSPAQDLGDDSYFYFEQAPRDAPAASIIQAIDGVAPTWDKPFTDRFNEKLIERDRVEPPGTWLEGIERSEAEFSIEALLLKMEAS